MKIAAYHSYFNGLEHLLVHKPELWGEIENALKSVDAEACRANTTAAKQSEDKRRYSTIAMCGAMKAAFEGLRWTGIERNARVMEEGGIGGSRTVRIVVERGEDSERETLIDSYDHTDFVKDRVALEVQFGKYAFVAFDLFVKHLAFYLGDVIEVGVEILPMKELQGEMSSGPSYYEGELYNLIREGSSVPAVPLVLVGVAR